MASLVTHPADVIKTQMQVELYNLILAPTQIKQCLTNRAHNVNTNDAGGRLQDKTGCSSSWDVEGVRLQGLLGRACSQVGLLLFIYLGPDCLGAHKTFTFHLVLLPLCPDTLVALLLLSYFNLCAQACEENCNGCPCLDCLRENALCNGSQKLELELARTAMALKTKVRTS